jgi:hypothetical protein
MHPEESILDLEEQLNGIETKDFRNCIDDFFLNRDIILFGISPENFKEVIQMALDN